jgi:hypothetical protein
MTVSSDVNRISYAGNGSTTVFPVNYYFLENSHLQVILITSAGVETIQTLTTNYTVTGAGNEAGGSVTMLVAPPVNVTIVIQRSVPATQETDYLANDPFPAESHERALDKLTMLAQQNEREIDRALKIPLASVATTSTELPIPVANKLLAWNSNATAITNFDPAAIISIVGQQTSYGDVFTGNGATVNFTLSRSPGSVFNLDVSVNGVTQVPNVDYTLGGAILTFTSAPPAVASKILARYSEVYEEVDADAQNVRYLPAGVGAQLTNVQAKLRQTVSVKDFGAVGDGVADDAVAVQAAIDSVETLGGNLVFPPGKYLFGSQVTINRTYAASGSNFVGERNLIVSGYGAEIRTTGAITAFDVKGGWIPNHNCMIEGFTIYHRGNTQAVGGIRMIGASLVTCKEISVVVSSSLPAGYAAFSMENVDPADGNTGCFWNLIDQCSVRPWSGVDGFVTYGVKLMGAANATTLRDNTFSGSNTHVILMPHPGQTTSPNSVNIDGNFFEGPAAAIGIELNSLGVLYHVTGARITNNRFEAINTAVTLTGTGTTVQLPTYMSGNYADTAVTNYVVNTLNIPLVMLDFVIVGSPMGPAKMHNTEGVQITVNDAAYSPLTLKTIGFNKGLELRRQSDNVLLGSIGYSNVAGGIGMQLAGSFSPDYRPLTIKGCQGIAAKDISANNLAGTAAFSAGTSIAVTFPVAEANANYLIFLDSPANQTLWVTSKATTGFTINSSVSNSTTVGWLLIRHL